MKIEQVCCEVGEVIRITQLLLRRTEEAAAVAVAAKTGRREIMDNEPFCGQVCDLLLAAVTENPLATPAKMDECAQKVLLLQAAAPAAPTSQEGALAAGRAPKGVLVPCGGETRIVQLSDLLRDICQMIRATLDASHDSGDVQPQETMADGERAANEQPHVGGKRAANEALADDGIAYDAEIFLEAMLTQGRGGASRTDLEMPERRLRTDAGCAKSLLAGLVLQHERLREDDEDDVQVGALLRAAAGASTGTRTRVLLLRTALLRAAGALD